MVSESVVDRELIRYTMEKRHMSAKRISVLSGVPISSVANAIHSQTAEIGNNEVRQE